MAVMRNSIIFGGVDSADYGIYIGGEGTFNAPKRDVEMISIPGRNGAFALDKGRFENIEVTYSAFNYETDLATFAQNLSDFRNAICSQKGYQRLTDTFHTDEYRMAAYIDGLEIKPVNFNTASTFDIVFDCKPQRFLTSGEDPITIGEWHETETASGTIASFEAKEGDGVKSLVVDIEPVQSGSGTPSPDNVRPISGYGSLVTSVTGKNLCPSMSATTHHGVTFTPREDGGYALSGTASGNAVLDIGRNTWTLPAGTYTVTLSGSSNASITTFKIVNGTATTIGVGQTTFTLAEATSIFVRLFVSSGATASGNAYVQLELGSSASAFEPYNSTTYTTSLSGTRYGGSLDVLTGVLTVNRAFITLDGSSDEAYTEVFTSTVKSILYTPTDAPKSYVTAAIPPHNISNYLLSRSRSNISGNLQGFAQYNNGLRINITGLTSVDEYRAYFVSNPLQIAYELETPQTVQLTAQEVELLVGLNQIWANSGDVSVEYGTTPNVVVNPTLFEARPMLEVEGYGTIGFNGYEIELADTTLGEIVLASAPAMPLRVLTFDKNKVANGDPIFFTSDPNFYATYMVKRESSVSSVSITTLSHTNVIVSQYDLTEKTKIISLTLDVSAGFVAGTPSSITGSWSGTLSYVVSGTTYTTTLSATLSIEFDGDHTIYFNISDLSGIPQTYFSGGTADNGRVEISAISSVGSLGHPTYIDCDLGEAYMIKDGVPISLDAYIDLGSDLPCLAVGANEFTYDNTVTDLKVIPRWWKV